MTIPAAFVAGYRKAHPEAHPQDIQNLYNKLLEANPGIANMDPKTVGAAMHDAMKNHLANGGQVQGYADGGEVDENGNPIEELPQVQVSGMNPMALRNRNLAEALPVPNPTPYTGQTTEQLQQAFDPAAVKKAYDTTKLQEAYQQQQQMFNDTMANKAVSAMLGGGYGPSASEIYKDKDAQNMLQTISKQAALLGFGIKEQEALQKQATDSLAAGKSVIDVAKDQQDLFGKYADNIGKGLNTEQQQRFNKPNSPETKIAKAMIAKAIQQMPGGVPKEVLDELKDPNTTAAKLIPLMTQFMPSVMAAYKDSVGLNKAAAESAKAAIEAQGAQMGNEAVGQELGVTPNYPGATPYYPPSGGQNGTTKTDQSAPQIPSVATPSNMQVQPQVQADRDQERLRILNTELQNTTDPASRASLQREILATTAMIKKNSNPETMSQTEGEQMDKFLKGQGPIAERAAQPGMPSAPVMNPVNSFKHDANFLIEANPEQLTQLQKLEQAKLGSTNADEIINLDRQIAKLKGEQYPKPAQRTLGTITAGQAPSLQVSPSFEAGRQQTGNDINMASAQVNQFNQGGKEAAIDAIKNIKMAGLNFNNYVKAGDPAAQQFAQSVNKLNHDAQVLGVISGGENAGGSEALGHVGAGVAAAGANPVSKLAGAALIGTSALLSGNQPIKPTDDAATIQKFAYAVQVAAQRKAALLSKMQAYAKGHNDNAVDFPTSEEYKAVLSAKPLVNARTGEILLPITKAQRMQLKQQMGPDGYPEWGDLSQFLNVREKKPTDNSAWE